MKITDRWLRAIAYLLAIMLALDVFQFAVSLLEVIYDCHP